MKFCLILGFVLCACALLPGSAVAQVPDKAIGSYTWRFSDREGRPSKCDCDYYEEQIDLLADGTFLYLEQRGRLDAKQQWERGTWAWENDSLIVLRTTDKKGHISIFNYSEKQNNEWRAETDQHAFIWDRWRLHSWESDKIYE